MEILHPGLLSTIQDLGRFGYQASGFAPTGASDFLSMKRANALVGNDPGEAVLEMMLLGITAKFHTACVIAITGADMTPKINGFAVENGVAIRITPGDVLEFSGTRGGTCCYLAVSGGFDIPLVMGSRSTGLRFAVGGFNGRKLKMGDQLKLRAPVPDLPNFQCRRLTSMPVFSKHVVLRAIAGPQDFMFSDTEIAGFFSRPYSVTNATDRMGIRLEGEPIVPKVTSDIISDGTVFGAIQVPSGGQPIILMADRQTTGGYAKIATIITADLPRAAQMTPGCTVRFMRVTIDQAQDILALEKASFEEEYRLLNATYPNSDA
ncbi:MAG: biotin-dependent carboxyltransferase family protein [Clostridiales bacterium]|nr:biotin-dependent carboxyltransferase family protein [Clostridiales bacterium]